MMANWRIREIGTADFSVLPALETAADQMFATLPGYAEIADMAGASPNAYQALGDGARVWLAESDVPVGFIYTEPEDRHAYLGQVSVHPAAQGRGLGAALIQTAMDAATREGYLGLTLLTYRDVPWNYRYYLTQGFDPIVPKTIGADFAARAKRDDANWSRFGPRIAMVRKCP